jgi:hypothetical protein
MAAFGYRLDDQSSQQKLEAAGSKTEKTYIAPTSHMPEVIFILARIFKLRLNLQPLPTDRTQSNSKQGGLKVTRTLWAFEEAT